MKRTWVRFEAVMTQGSEGKMAALHQENPEGEKRSTERLKEALNCAVVNPKVKSMMKQVGMEDGKSNLDAVVASIVAGAIQGTPSYAKLLVELIRETGLKEGLRERTSARRSASRFSLPRDHPRVCGENLSPRFRLCS